MLFNLLTSDSAAQGDNGMGSLLMLGIMVLVFIAFSVYNRRTQKKRQEEAQKQLDAIKAGTKLKTIGGIMGTVVKVCEDNAFILETGDEEFGKSYIKLDKQSVYQSDAVVEDKKEEAPAKESKDAE